MWPTNARLGNTHIIQRTGTMHCIDLNRCRIAETAKQGDKRIIILLCAYYDTVIHTLLAGIGYKAFKTP